MDNTEVGVLGVGAVFAEYSEHLEKEAEVKENLRLTIKELEQAARDIHPLLQRVHRPGGVRDTPAPVVWLWKEPRCLCDGSSVHG